MIQYFRALFPRWNFFDQIAYNFEIQFKTADLLPWQTIQFMQRRPILSLFYNPTCNLALAHINILEHFVRDVQEFKISGAELSSNDVQKMVSFKMIQALVRQKIYEIHPAMNSFQFKIVACKADESFDLFLSDWVVLK